MRKGTHHCAHDCPHCGCVWRHVVDDVPGCSLPKMRTCGVDGCPRGSDVTVIPMMPFALDRNLGRAYNEAMALLPDDAWAVMLDHDIHLTTRQWYPQIVEAIQFKPGAGAFCAMANRIAPAWQQIGDPENFDIAHHRQFGKERLQVRTLLDITDTKGFGGVLFAVSKRAWREVGGFADGLLCVDHSLFFALQRHGYRSYLIEGLYVYHWRRAFGDNLPKDTPRAKDCPCRGPEQMPTVRLTLPERIAA